MFGQLVAKLLLKACVPLVAVAGVMSYGVYLKGGDPGALWRHVGSGALGQASGMFTQAKGDAASMVDKVADTVGVAGAAPSSTKLFTWKDASGTTHFSSIAPDDVNAQAITVDPNVNVVAPVPVARVANKPANTMTVQGQKRLGSVDERSNAATSQRHRPDPAVQQLEAELGGPLPGFAGQILSSGGGKGGLDANQLIRLLQSSGQQ